MRVRIRKGKHDKYALTHINYDIAHGHLEVWTQDTNTAPKGGATEAPQ